MIEHRMPLYINTECITDDNYHIDSIPEHRWYPVYCRSNKEKKLIEYAVRKGISCYLPEMERYRITRGHRITTMVPMFTGYCFLCVSRQENWDIKKSQYAIRMLPVDDGNEPDLISELNIVRTFENLAKTQKVEFRPELTPGKRVVVTQGKLLGIEGIIKRRKNKMKVIVNLDFLGYSLATVEAYDLELV